MRRLRNDCDENARFLLNLSKEMRQMPPSWHGGGKTLPVLTNGGVVGTGLPGAGLALNGDLKHLGINKPLPGVFERSRLRKYIDYCLGDERGAITTYAQILAQRRYGKMKDVLVYKGDDPTGGDTWKSTWRSTQGSRGAGAFSAIPTQTILTKTSAGSYSWQIPDHSGGGKTFIVSVGYGTNAVTGPAVLADFLSCVGSIDSSVGTLQDIDTNPVTRYTDGIGNLLFCEIQTSNVGAVATLNVTYTNQGSASTTQVCTIATAPLLSGDQSWWPARMAGAQLADGDYGIVDLADATVTSLSTSGLLGLIILQPLVVMFGNPGSSTSGGYNERDLMYEATGLVEMKSGAYLNAYYSSMAASQGNAFQTWFIRTVED